MKMPVGDSVRENSFSQDSYLACLAARTAAGFGEIDETFRARHAAALLGFMRPGGGFAGRRGGADLYYTAFAARALHALGKLAEDASVRIRAYVAAQQPKDIIDRLNLLNTALLVGGRAGGSETALAFVEAFRAPDGGYAKKSGAAAGSTYHSFLAALCYDLFGMKNPDVKRLYGFAAGRRRNDGGFCETPVAARSSTNVTAAGISLLGLAGGWDARTADGVRNFLEGARTPSGGWRAGAMVPVPDLLSTFSALAALESIGGLGPDLVKGALVFARSCEERDGGFRAGPWDDAIDVEYTYYGLGIVAMAREKHIDG